MRTIQSRKYPPRSPHSQLGPCRRVKGTSSKYPLSDCLPLFLAVVDEYPRIRGGGGRPGFTTKRVSGRQSVEEDVNRYSSHGLFRTPNSDRRGQRSDKPRAVEGKSVARRMISHPSLHTQPPATFDGPFDVIHGRIQGVKEDTRRRPSETNAPAVAISGSRKTERRWPAQLVPRLGYINDRVFRGLLPIHSPDIAPLCAHQL